MSRCVVILLAACAPVSAFGYSGAIEGKLFYNDMRKHGDFAWRFDPSGKRGAPHNLSDTASSSSVNWLGGLYHARAGDADYAASGSFTLELQFSLFTGSSLALRRTANGLELTWDETAAVLEEVETIRGPWTELIAASSPGPIAPAEPQRFFRLRRNGP